MNQPQLLCITVFVIYLSSVKSQEYRLPEALIPYSYAVDLFVPQGAFTGENNTFEGEVTINFTASSNTSLIEFHHRVNITDFGVTTTTGEDLTVANTTFYDNTTEICIISLQKVLSVGTNYSLYIKYYGIFETENLRGFYRSTYEDENNETSYLVLTNFEPVHARHAFPCFDEPHYKAKFALSLTYPTGLNALGNTPIANTSVVDSIYSKSTYEETTTMSSYLLGFAISSFTCTEGYTIEKYVSHRVCSRPEEAANRAWAVEFGSTAMRGLESTTGIKYGSYISKIDELAIPDFASEASENWGLVNYRETYLLWNEEESSNNYKKSIALAIAQEFAQAWFGNLVTCKLWNYLFLSAGFARYYQYFGAAATRDLLSWELDKQFNVEVVQVALLADSTTSADALTSNASSPTEISAKFSTITYSKGAAIFRMIEKCIMGDDNFVYGLREYLTTYAQQSTVPDNLWSSLSNHVPSNALPSGVNLSTTINNWVELSGHPVVYVNKSGNDIILTQERFLLSGNDTTQYYVPITYTVSKDVTTFSNTTVKSWLAPNQSLTISGVLNGSKWIVLNNRQSGFYRVDYDSTLWRAIKSQLRSNHLRIDVLNRAQLVSDAYSFARSSSNSGYGNWSYSDLFDLLSYLEDEEDYYPWYAALSGNDQLLQKIGYESEVGQQFTTWMLGLMKKVYSTVPIETDDSSNQVYTTKQTLINTKACKYGEEDCVSKAKTLFADYKNNGTKVPKNLRSIVYCNGLRNSDDSETDFNFLWQRYTETKLKTETNTILSGLGCTTNTTLLKRYLGQTINTTSGIRSQDFASVWSYVYSSSKNGTSAALEYIAENYTELVAAYNNVETLISNVANYVHDTEQLDKLKTLANLTEISSSHNATVQTAISTANSNIEWATTVSEKLKSYLDTQTTAYCVSKSSVCGLSFSSCNTTKDSITCYF